jgi:hypothetical protein
MNSRRFCGTRSKSTTALSYVGFLHFRKTGRMGFSPSGFFVPFVAFCSI